MKTFKLKAAVIIMPVVLIQFLDTSGVRGQPPQWSEVATGGSLPSPRYDHCMAFDGEHQRVVLFGGYAADGSFLGDTWVWDGMTWAAAATTGPTARGRSAMAYDSVRRRIVLFGGLGAEGQLKDTWEWDGNVWIAVPAATSPSARADHAMTYDAANQKVVLFGGYSTASGGFNGETWLWNGNTWFQENVTGPSVRYTHELAYDAARQRVVLFGGFNPNRGYLNDTWLWDGSGWTQPIISNPVPGTRQTHAMAYDSARQRIVLFGGFSGASNTVDGETWEWNGTSWAQNSDPGPSARYRNAMAYDAARCLVLLFGGAPNEFGAADGDTWRYGIDRDNNGIGDSCDNQPPDCSGAHASLATIWPPNHRFVLVSVQGVTDPDGDAVGITITSIYQDEPVAGNGEGAGNTLPDGDGVGTSTAQVRAERNGNGNGRVYHIRFSATDGRGGTCDGEVTVCVPHDQGHGSTCVDNGPLYDSTRP